MMNYIIRIPQDWLRIPLLCFAFPLHMLHYVIYASLPVAFGGHPNKHRLLEYDFYYVPLQLFWAGWDGFFVEQ